MSLLDVITTTKKYSLKHPHTQVWVAACDQLDIELRASSGTAQGVVAGHRVKIALVSGSNGVRTSYSVAFDAPHAPEFALTPSTDTTEGSLVDLTFEGLVNISTQDSSRMDDFLTAERKSLIKTTMRRWQAVVLTHTHATVSSDGIETDPREMVLAVDHLVSLAEAVSPCWAEVALDEGSVLRDLFEPSRSVDQIATRFEQLYRGSEVTWTGQILQLGGVEKLGRRAMVFVGSSNNTAKRGAMWGGRVVATTLIDPDLKVEKGEIVSFAGGLRNLDASKRLFQIDDSSAWKLRPPLLG